MATRSTVRNEGEAGLDRLGAKELVCGEKLGLRMWESDGTRTAQAHEEYSAEHESVVYCLSGKAELTLEGQKLRLEPGHSWLVPPHARHSYKVLEAPFKALEATVAPPVT